jgi:hypothetical protein
VKVGVRAVSSNAVAGQANPETVSATPVKAWESNKKFLRDSFIGLLRAGQPSYLIDKKLGKILSSFDYGYACT